METLLNILKYKIDGTPTADRSLESFKFAVRSLVVYAKKENVPCTFDVDTFDFEGKEWEKHIANVNGNLDIAYIKMFWNDKEDITYSIRNICYEYQSQMSYDGEML